jgi:pimeloyl-ACP methyl ester carboxylesterase
MSTPNTTINVSWTVPNAPSTTCKVRATVLYANGSVADVSDANFTISQPIPTVTVTSPNGGENWQVGSSHNITATSSGSITSVEIDYSTDGGSSWAYITGYSPLNNTINVSWTVPNTPSTTAKVKVIVGYSGGNVADVSDANFTISPPPALVISSVTPSAIQTKDWGQVVVYTVTVTDSIGNPVNGAVVGGDDNVQMVPYTTSPNTTDASGQITYFTSVPSGKADGTYNITFVATRSGYNTSSTVTRQVQIQHIPTSFGGTVTNSSTGNPISGATVTWGSSYSTTTAANGGYSFNNIVCGTATLTVSANGYQTYSQSYTPTCNTINLKSISLVPGLSGIVAGSNTVANQTTPVFIQLFPNPGHIDPTKQTWIVIHGRNSSSINTSGANIVRLAQDILAQRPNDQVLVLDWSAAAQDDNPSIYYPLDITPFTHDDWIEPIAQWAATALTGYGFSGLSLNLVGHSWGGNMTDEIAKRITGGVNTIVALDPAKNGIFGYHGAYNPDSNFGSQSAQINFARDSQYSWAFHSSFEGSEYTSTSADEAFVVNTGLNQVDPPDAHNASVNLFSYMLEHSTDNTDSVSPLFQLQRLLAHTAGPWLPDQRNTLPFIATLPLAWGAVTVTLIEDNIPGYEGIITTMVDLQNPKPALFDYVPTSPQITLLGNGISIADGDTTPSTTDGTDFGSVTQGQTGPTHTFTVRNDGGSTLTLGSVSVPIGFILDVGLPTSLAHGVSGTFTVRLATTSAGTKNGQVSFSNNDPNQNPFNFSITGTVTTPVDTTPPALTINSPANGAVVTSASLPVNGTASDSGLGNNGISSVTVNGANATGGTTSGSGTASWSATVTLVSGVNTITVVAKDTLNNSTQKVVSVTYNPPEITPPALTINSPANGAVVTSANLPVNGTASDSGLGNNGISSVTVNGASATGGTASGTATANWSATVTLVSGVNTITVVAKDTLNNSTQKVVSVTYNPPETTPPSLTIASPVNGAVVTSANLPVNGTASDSGLGNNGISSVTVNGANASGGTISGSGTASWSATVTLVSGVNTITVVAKDTLNNSTQKVVSVTYNPPETTPPALTIASPVNGAVVTSASLPVNGTASDSGLGNNGISSVTVNGANASGGTTSGSGTASWNATVTLVSGVNTITVVAKDTLNNSTQKVVSVTYNPSTTIPVITSPTPGSTLTSASVTFQWSSGMGVTNYFLFVGSSLGAFDIYNQEQGLNTSATVNGLPQNGSKLYVRFWWATTAAGWTFTDYTYTAPTSAPLLGISKPGTSMVFSWPTSATGYILQSSPNLGSAAVWSTASPSPVVVGGQNVVTNAMSGSRMFFRLMHP